jgi:chemotaxis protein methyltransferase CheR
MTNPTTLSPGDYGYVRTLIKDRAALVLEDGKEYLVEARLGPLARREGFATLEEFLARLKGHPIDALHRKAVEAMTINETSFFRDWRPFELLKKTVVPELIVKNGPSRQLTIWSAASSSGQEPYSLAILLRENFSQLATWNVKIFATDVSLEMVERSKSGRYSQLEVNRGMPAPLLVKHFTRVGLDWLVKDDLRKMIDFLPANLAADWPSMPRLDVVFLRNVMIYFDLDTKRRILGRVRTLLKPGGLLFLGAAETTLNVDNAYERVTADGTSYYRSPGV